MGGLALSFALWGIADIFKGNVSDTVVTVGSTEVSTEEFKTEYERDVRQYSNQSGQQITPDMARAMGIPQLALQKMISRIAVDNVARDMGLTVSDGEVSAEIQADRNFAGPLGTFDKPTFDRLMALNGLTEERYIATIRGDMIRQQLVGSLEDGFQIPDGYLAALFASGNERRAVEYVVLTPQSAAPVAPPSDAVLAAYVKAHPERYSTPEYRDVSFAWLAPSDVAGQVSVSPAQIEQQYEANSSTYIVAEKRDLEQINFPNEADAKAARAKIDAGQTFAQIAAARGLKPADISIGTRVAADLDKDVAAAAFALPINGVTQPVKAAFGYALIHVTAITPGSTTTLAKAAPAIKTQLLAELENAKLTDIANAYSDALGGGADVETAATRTGMHYGHVAAIDANGLGPDGKPTAAPKDAEFLVQVFKSDVGEAGDPFSAKDGTSYAVKVDGVTPPHLKPLAQVRAEATVSWMAEQQAIRLKAQAASFAAEATRSQSLADIARRIGAAVQTSPALDRRTANDTFSPALIQAIFEAAPGGAVSGPLGKGNGVVIARVSGIVHPQIAPGTPIFEQGKQEISGQMAADISTSFANEERGRQRATVNNKLLDNATGAGTGEGS